MWAYRLLEPGTMERCAAPDPGPPAPGQVVLRMTAGGICGSDLPFFRGGDAPVGPSGMGAAIGRPGFPMHEVTGEVVASAHPGHAAGDVVVGWASGFDGIAEFVTADGEGLAGYDRRLDPATAILLQPLACVIYAVEQLGEVSGKHVAVIGLGPIGLLFAHVLRAAGAARVTGVDRVDRRELGKLLGADDVVWAAADRWTAEVEAGAAERPGIVVEAVGHQSLTVGCAIRAVAPEGRIYVFGIPDEPSYALDLRLLLRKNLTLQAGAAKQRRRVLAAAGAYLDQHRELETTYVTDVLPVTEIERAFRRALNPRPRRAKIAVVAP